MHPSSLALAPQRNTTPGHATQHGQAAGNQRDAAPSSGRRLWLTHESVNPGCGLGPSSSLLGSVQQAPGPWPSPWVRPVFADHLDPPGALESSPPESVGGLPSQRSSSPYSSRQNGRGLPAPASVLVLRAQAEEQARTVVRFHRRKSTAARPGRDGTPPCLTMVPRFPSLQEGPLWRVVSSR